MSGGDDGASAVEYALMISGIAALIVATVVLFGGFVGEIFTDSCDAITTSTNPGYDCTP